MAGAYPDVPAHRMAWDRDGTVGLIFNGGFGAAPVTMSAAQRAAGNNEWSDFMHFWDNAGTFGYAFVFPEARTVVGYSLQIAGTAGSTVNSVQWSPNTTNGQDGTWNNATQLDFLNNGGTANTPYMRNSIMAMGAAAGATGVRFVRTGGNGSHHPTTNWHLYGAPLSAPHRLRFWHPTSDAEVGGAYFDWGDVPRSTEILRDFRVRNPSATLTAGGVVVSSEALTPGSPSHASMHTFSLDGVNFFSSLNIGNLAPGAVSATVRVRRATPSESQLGLWWTRIVAHAGAWS